MTKPIIVILKLIIIAGFLFLHKKKVKERLSFKAYTYLLAMIAVLGLASYINFFGFHLKAGNERIHYWDTYHYYIGTKYYHELGQTEIYEATVIADYEDAPGIFKGNETIRDLAGDKSGFIRRDSILKKAGEIKKKFSHDRWVQFKSDIAFFRNLDPKLWLSSRVQRDHGYNGTPLTTAILGTLANQKVFDTKTFIRIITWGDIFLAIAVTCLIAILFDLQVAMFFLFFWAINPFNDYSIIGGSYLRYNYYFLLTLAILLYYKRRWVWSGICFSLSALLRIFPGFIVGFLILYHLISPQRRTLFKQHRTFYLSVIMTSLIVMAITSFPRPVDGVSPWVGFFKRITTHSESITVNKMGLQSLFRWAGVRDYLKMVRETGNPEMSWEKFKYKTYQGRKFYYYGSVLLLFCLIMVGLRNSDEATAFFAGIFFIFISLMLSNYYYCILSVIPLIFLKDKNINTYFCLFLIITIITYALKLIIKDDSVRFYFLSIEVFIFLLVIGFYRYSKNRPLMITS